MLSFAEVIRGQCSENAKPEFRGGRSHKDLVVTPLPMQGSLPLKGMPLALSILS